MLGWFTSIALIWTLAQLEEVVLAGNSGFLTWDGRCSRAGAGAEGWADWDLQETSQMAPDLMVTNSVPSPWGRFAD